MTKERIADVHFITEKNPGLTLWFLSLEFGNYGSTDNIMHEELRLTKRAIDGSQIDGRAKA